MFSLKICYKQNQDTEVKLKNLYFNLDCPSANLFSLVKAFGEHLTYLLSRALLGFSLNNPFTGYIEGQKGQRSISKAFNLIKMWIQGQSGTDWPGRTSHSMETKDKTRIIGTKRDKRDFLIFLNFFFIHTRGCRASVVRQQLSISESSSFNKKINTLKVWLLTVLIETQQYEGPEKIILWHS